MTVERLRSGEPSEQGRIVDPEDRLIGTIFGCSTAPIYPEFAEDRRRIVQQVLETLTETEQTVLKHRLGFATGSPQTLKEVGKLLPKKKSHGRRMEIVGTGVTGARVGQIETKALRKLRHPSRSKILWPFVPLEENSLGKSVLGLNCRYEFDMRFPHIKPALLSLKELNLPEESLQELELKEPMIDERLAYSPTIITLSIAPLSPSTRRDIIQAFEYLEEKKAGGEMIPGR